MKRKSCLVFAGYMTALLLMLWSMLGDVVSLSTNEYTSLLITICVTAATSLLLVVFLWRWIPAGGRVIGGGHRAR